jgi:endonuclease/exonuclease/phosphatase family metal-dependent hydrolase
MSPMETRGAHSKRYSRQIEVLKKLRRGSSDIFSFQEVNPLPERLDQIKAALDLDGGSCLVNAGVKFGKFGIPVGLHEGLAILRSHEFQNSKVTEATLSGGATEFATNPPIVFQISERRKALLFEGTLDGRTVGIVNLHLHHGPDTNPKNLERKTSELRRLKDWIEPKMANWDLAAVCGDFNCAGTSPCLEPLLSLGFQDSAVLAGVQPKPTWDPTVNPLARQSSILADSPETKAWDGTAQVLDRIYLKSKIPLQHVNLTQIREPELSDHFGLDVEIFY